MPGNCRGSRRSKGGAADSERGHGRAQECDTPARWKVSGRRHGSTGVAGTPLPSSTAATPSPGTPHSRGFLFRVRVNRLCAAVELEEDIEDFLAAAQLHVAVRLLRVLTGGQSEFIFPMEFGNKHAMLVGCDERMNNHLGER